MRIHEISDVHLEFGAYIGDGRFDSYEAFPKSDVLILAGDIFVPKLLEAPEPRARRFLDAAHESTSHILYIPGNHEYYDGDISEVDEMLRKFCAAQGIVFMDGLFVVGDVVFIGRTLWTDYNGLDERSMGNARRRMNDHRVIRNRERAFTPEDAYQIHQQHRADLGVLISDAKVAGFEKVVVFTHHAPSKKSTHPKYANDVPLNGAYSSNLEYLMGGVVKLWFHGHTHESFDYDVKGTRVIANPRGYAGHETNPNFNPSLIVEI